MYGRVRMQEFIPLHSAGHPRRCIIYVDFPTLYLLLLFQAVTRYALALLIICAEVEVSFAGGGAAALPTQFTNELMNQRDLVRTL